MSGSDEDRDRGDGEGRSAAVHHPDVEATDAADAYHGELYRLIHRSMDMLDAPQFVEQLVREVPYYNQRHNVKPGLAGWAQLNYPYGASVEDSMEKLKFDLYYVKHQSLLLDILILIRTVEIVLFGKGR